MPHLISAENEMLGYKELLKFILSYGKRNGNNLEILACTLCISFHRVSWEKFCDFKNTYLRVGGGLAQQGWNKATRVYTSVKDRPTKPSYLNRLIAYPDITRKGHGAAGGLNQIEKISLELARKPGYSNLSFVFLRPADLFDQFRPGYVPCVIAGDFKFRSGLLHLNVMFRTCDVFSVGFADIYYLRKLQQKVLFESQQITGDKRLELGQLGNLNLFFSRAFIEKSRKLKSPNGNISRKKVIPVVQSIINEIESQME